MEIYKDSDGRHQLIISRINIIFTRVRITPLYVQLFKGDSFVGNIYTGSKDEFIILWRDINE